MYFVGVRFPAQILRLAKLGCMAAKLPLLNPYPKPPLRPAGQPNPEQCQKIAATQLVALFLLPPTPPKASSHHFILLDFRKRIALSSFQSQS